ncbi:unnamed protein product [Choristocarpus tenellus]
MGSSCAPIDYRHFENWVNPPRSLEELRGIFVELVDEGIALGVTAEGLFAQLGPKEILTQKSGSGLGKEGESIGVERIELREGMATLSVHLTEAEIDSIFEYAGCTENEVLTFEGFASLAKHSELRDTNVGMSESRGKDEAKCNIYRGVKENGDVSPDSLVNSPNIQSLVICPRMTSAQHAEDMIGAKFTVPTDCITPEIILDQNTNKIFFAVQPPSSSVHYSQRSSGTNRDMVHGECWSGYNCESVQDLHVHASMHISGEEVEQGFHSETGGKEPFSGHSDKDRVGTTVLQTETCCSTQHSQESMELRDNISFLQCGSDYEGEATEEKMRERVAATYTKVMGKGVRGSNFLNHGDFTTGRTSLPDLNGYWGGAGSSQCGEVMNKASNISNTLKENIEGIGGGLATPWGDEHTSRDYESAYLSKMVDGGLVHGKGRQDCVHGQSKEACFRGESGIPISRCGTVTVMISNGTKSGNEVRTDVAGGVGGDGLQQRSSQPLSVGECGGGEIEKSIRKGTGDSRALKATLDTGGRRRAGSRGKQGGRGRGRHQGSGRKKYPQTLGVSRSNFVGTCLTQQSLMPTLQRRGGNSDSRSDGGEVGRLQQRVAELELVEEVQWDRRVMV